MIQADKNNEERPFSFLIHLYSVFDMVMVSHGLGKRTIILDCIVLSYFCVYLNYITVSM